MGDYRGTKRSKAAGQIPQDEHLASGNAKKVMSGILAAPASLAAVDTTTARHVGKGNICRIRVAAQTFVAFGASDIGAVSSTTPTALELNDAGVYLIVASDDYIRSSIAVQRIEIITG